MKLINKKFDIDLDDEQSNELLGSIKKAGGEDYYNVGGISVLEILEAKLPKEQYRGFLRGNALKYLLRMGNKPNETDAKEAEKAANYAVLLEESYAKDVTA